MDALPAYAPPPNATAPMLSSSQASELGAPPHAAPGSPIALILSVGRNPASGWRRMMTDVARALAREGIATLRFDLGGVGDSMAAPGQPERLVYSDWPQRDVRAALDFVAAQGFGPAILVGMCSGAYLALHTATGEPRVRGLVCFNLYRIVWGPDESIDHALRFANRPIGASVGRHLAFDKVMDVLRGRSNPWGRLAHVGGTLRRKVELWTTPVLGRLNPRYDLYRRYMGVFETLRARHIPIALGYSDTDDGLADLRDHFGDAFGGLGAFPDVALSILPRCDHNLTNRKADAWMIAQVRSVVDKSRA